MDRTPAPGSRSVVDGVFSMGDLTALVGMVRDSVVSEATARRLAAAASWGSREEVAIAGAIAGLRRVRGSEGPAEGHTLAALAFAIADSIDGGNDGAWRVAGLAFVTTAAELLAEVPDRTLFQRVREVERRLVDVFEGQEQLGMILAIIGSARLVPFALSPSHPTNQAQISESWYLRQVLRDGLMSEQDVLPESREALRDAAKSLTRAVELLRGRDRARALADLAHTRLTQLRSGEDIDLGRLERDCQEALPLLHGDAFTRSQVLFVLASIGALDAPEAFLLDPSDINKMIDAEGLRRAVMTAILAIRFGLARNPALCRAMRTEMLARMPDDRLEVERCWLEQIGAHLLDSDPLSCDQAATETLAGPLPDTWGAAQTVGAAIHVLAHSEHGNIAELKPALEVISTSADLGRPARVILALRSVEWAKDRTAAGDHVTATASHVHAAGEFARLGFRELALNALLCTRHSVVTGSPETAVAALSELRNVADELSAQLVGSGGMSLLRTIYGEAFTRMSEWSSSVPREGEHVMVDSLVLAMQMAKGRVFTATLCRAGPQEDDETAAAVLNLAADTEPYLPDGPEALLTEHRYGDLVREFVDDEAILSAHWHPREIEEGDGPASMVVNLRRRYQQLDQIRSAVQNAQVRVPYSAVELTAALPVDVVLATFYYWGVGRPPRAGFHCLLCTSDGPSYLAVFDPRRPAIMNLTSFVTPGLDGAAPTAINSAEAAFQTAHVRRCLADDPLHGAASREAIDALADSGGHFQPVLDALIQLHASGRKHLILWPHGSQYLFPFHLLPTGPGKIVADDWTMTVIPSVESVMGSPRQEVKTEIVVLGCPSGGASQGLPSEPAVVEQAWAVARAFGSEPMAPATRDHFRKNARGARYLHIAAHGVRYDPAPLFHHIFLDDGPFYAHDVLKLDLRSVDLVTVSACESALVRYDENDNLLGLPAAFLRAGASAVVGALWPIDPDTATDFFASLYHVLAGGAGKLARIVQ